MPRPSGTPPRSAPYAALLAVLTLLSSLLLPVFSADVARAAEAPAGGKPSAPAAPVAEKPAAPAAEAPAAEDCAPLALAHFGDPGTAVGTAALAGNGTACFTFTAQQPGMHRVLLAGRSSTRPTIYDGETGLDCYEYKWGEGWCRLPRSGQFILRLTNDAVDSDEASVTVTPLFGTEGCLPATGTSWDQEPLTGTATNRVGLLCQLFTGKPGERVTVDFKTVKSGYAHAWITDGTGVHICETLPGEEGCVLPGEGPYRVLVEVWQVQDGFPAAYTMAIRRLSDPEGCATIAVNRYGTGPTAASPATDCKTFTAPTTGLYDVFGVAEPYGQRSQLKVYHRRGQAVCESGLTCSLTGGETYTVITGGPTLILDRAATPGCEPAALGTHDGSFAVAGEIDCLTLPLPENARLAILTPTGGAQPRPDITVVRGDGSYVCDDYSLVQGTCALTGPGPYRALVSTDDTQPPTGAYRLVLYRTDSVNTCPVFPAGDFTATSAAARISTGGGVFSHCLTIPADAHSVGEMLEAESGSGTTTIQYSVLDSTGKLICRTGSSGGVSINCALTPGLAHTVLFVGRDAQATYSLTRRDVTATAKGCPAAPAAPVTGPSSNGVPGAPGVVICRQVTTGNTGDLLHLNVRDALGTANFWVYDAQGGATGCGAGNRACAVTGSTSYQVVVYVPPYRQAADTYHLDALRIGTPSGPAPECTTVPNVTYGYGPVNGRLDEQHTATCLSLPTAAGDRFNVTVADTVGRTDLAVPALHPTGGSNPCYGSASSYECSVPGGSGASPTLFVLSLPEKASVTDYSVRLACAASYCGTEEVSIGTVSPTSAQGGKVVSLTVTGTALGMKDYVRLTNGSQTLKATTVSVSPDARTLTASLDLTSVGESTWSVSVIVRNSFQYSRGTFTVTKPATTSNLGTYKSLAPTRLMDTRSGLGVRQGKVGPDSSVTLQVTGKGGVPTTGVGAVVLNVTATSPTAAGFVSVYPDGTARTSASNLNFTAGQTIPNLVVVPVVNGKVTFYNRAGSVDLIADAAGYYATDGSGATYRPVTPTRLMDTRAGLGVPKAKVGAQKSVTLKVAGNGGLPATGVTAVVLNVTATAPTAASFVSVHPADKPRTSASNLNFTAGQTIPNLVFVPVSANGEVTFYNHAGSVDLIADVAGFFTMDGTGSAYHPMTPTRLMDTRSGTGVVQAKVGAGQTVTLQVAGRAGIPDTGVTAVVLNVTAVAPTAGGFVSVFPAGTVRTSASNLNFTAGTTIPNLVVVPVVNGRVSFYNHAGSVDLLADVAGYYVS
ncbi:hypothetical protein ACIRTB_07730 [Streptomyces sp. NPDC101158]|uniref:hypothetical protein n=1 Tax=Streptomyces sp. NPDC101158 TaxID=3366117 RepID=UPI0037FD7924